MIFGTGSHYARLMHDLVRAQTGRDVAMARVATLEAVLREIDDLVDNYVDIEDGAEGPRPNLAMQVQMLVRRAMGKE